MNLHSIPLPPELSSMDRRQGLQLRLQETVEGLSVIAMTYYGVGLSGYVLKPLAKAFGGERSALHLVGGAGDRGAGAVEHAQGAQALGAGSRRRRLRVLRVGGRCDTGGITMAAAPLT